MRRRLAQGVTQAGDTKFKLPPHVLRLSVEPSKRRTNAVIVALAQLEARDHSQNA
jgi:hypothetical protein